MIGRSMMHVGVVAVRYNKEILNGRHAGNDLYGARAQ